MHMARLPFYVDENDPPSKAALLRSALALFVADGIRDTSLRAIADHAGYTNPAVYKFFESKDALALYLFERCSVRFTHDVAAALASRGEPRVRMRALLTAMLALLDEEPEAVVFIHEEQRRFWRQCSPSLRKRSAMVLTRAFVVEGVAAGDITRAVGVPMLLAAFWGVLGEVSRRAYFKELEGRARDALPELERLVWRMFAP